MLTSATDRELNREFSTFCTYVPDKSWLRRVAALKSEIRGNPLLKQALREENAIAFALDQATTERNRGSLFPFDIATEAGHSAAILVAQSSALFNRLNEAQRRALGGRIGGAIKNNPSDLHAMLHEFSMATHFAKRGWEVTFPDVAGIGSNDLRIYKASGVTADVECKYLSADKGRKIHRRDALVLHRLIRLEIAGLSKNLKTGMLVQVRPLENLASEMIQLKRIASGVRTLLLSGKEELSIGGTTLIAKQFSVAESPLASESPTTQSVQEFVAMKTNLPNREVMVERFSVDAAVIVQLASYEKDNFRDAVLSTAIDAARRQLVGGEHNLLSLKIGGLNATELTRLGLSFESPYVSPNMLQLVANDFFASSNSSRICCLFFMADAQLLNDAGRVHRDGSTYEFWNPSIADVPDVLRTCFSQTSRPSVTR